MASPQLWQSGALWKRRPLWPRDLTLQHLLNPSCLSPGGLSPGLTQLSARQRSSGSFSWGLGWTAKKATSWVLVRCRCLLLVSPLRVPQYSHVSSALLISEPSLEPSEGHGNSQPSRPAPRLPWGAHFTSSCSRSGAWQRPEMAWVRNTDAFLSVFLPSLHVPLGVPCVAVARVEEER